MTDETERAKWAETLAYDAKYAEQTLLDFGEVLPMFLIHGSDGQVRIVNTVFEDDKQKAMAFSTIRTMALAFDAVAVSVMTEAWMRRRPRDDVPPSLSPDRVEVVSVVLNYRGADGRHTLNSMREIIRGADGKPTGLMPEESTGGRVKSQDGGNMADMVPPRPPTEMERAAAHDLVKTMTELQPIIIHAAGHA